MAFVGDTTISAHDLGFLLVQEGVLPPNCGNVELHIPVDGALVLRCDILVQDEDVPKILRAWQRLRRIVPPKPAEPQNTVLKEGQQPTRG
jgi:hypothetical protein